MFVVFVYWWVLLIIKWVFQRDALQFWFIFYKIHDQGMIWFRRNKGHEVITGVGSLSPVLALPQRYMYWLHCVVIVIFLIGSRFLELLWSCILEIRANTRQIRKEKLIVIVYEVLLWFDTIFDYNGPCDYAFFDFRGLLLAWINTFLGFQNTLLVLLKMFS